MKGNMKMVKYEDVYKWNVLDEVQKGNEVFVINKALYGRSDGISKINKMNTGEVLSILADDNESKKYCFYKIVKERKEKND